MRHHHKLLGLALAIAVLAPACIECPKPEKTCTDKDSESAKVFNIGLIDPKTKCGDEKTGRCTWAHSRQEAEQCAQNKAPGMQLAGSGFKAHNVAFCNPSNGCCDKRLAVWANNQSDANTCQGANSLDPGWMVWNPNDVGVFDLGQYRCKGHYTVGSSPTSTPTYITFGPPQTPHLVTARSRHDAERCIMFHHAKQLHPKKTIACDFN